MISAAERLAQLVPGLYLGKDDLIPGQPLLALFAVLGPELDALGVSVGALLDDHFVERASPAALHLLADLLGALLLGDDARTNRGILARTVYWRRRKGALVTLEDMLSVASGWSAEIDEGFRSLAITQDLDNLLPERGRTATLWDPIGLADPLSRRIPVYESRRASSSAVVLARGAGESIDDALRRLGGADVGRYAASPRTLDLRGWARPEAVLVRTARLVAVELENVSPGFVQQVVNNSNVYALDPLLRRTPVVYEQPLGREDLTGGLTAAHEPDLTPPAPIRVATALLTPTALAADPDAAEAAGALKVMLNGVLAIGPDPVPEPEEPLPAAPVGPTPALTLADVGRPSWGDAWQLELATALISSDPIQRVLISAVAQKLTYPSPDLSADANEESAGETIVLRVTHQSGSGALRTGGAWTALSTAPAEIPVSNAALVEIVAQQNYLVRLERVDQTLQTPQTLQIAYLDPTTQTGWHPLVPDSMPVLVDGASAGAVGNGNVLYLLYPDKADPSHGLGVWSLTFTGPTTVTVARLDTPGVGPRPPPRALAALCFQTDTIYLFGGLASEEPLGDVWLFSLATNTFTPKLVRHPKARAGASLVWQWNNLVLIGGQSVLGELDETVWRCDPSSARPVWRAIPSLPIPPNLPGTLVARPANGGIEALVWADRTRPCLLELDATPHGWTPSVIDKTHVDADVNSFGPPNPPAWGEIVYVAADVAVVGPSPLPPSEVVFSLEGESRLAFLPGLDLPLGTSVVFDVAKDGSTRRHHLFGEDAALYGRGPYAGAEARAADTYRLGAPGFLSRHRYLLRQRILSDAVLPDLLPDDDDVIGLDPRLGRIIVPANAVALGDVTTSFRVGRGAAIGAGCMPPDRRPLPYWQVPGEDPPAPPDVGPSGLPVTGWILRGKAGRTLRRRGVDIPVYGSLIDAVSAVPADTHPVIGMLDATPLPPTTVAGPMPRGFTLMAPDGGRVPVINHNVDDPSAPALSVCPDFGGSDATAIWLAGLWLLSRLDLIMSAGQVDVRWCSIGQPTAGSIVVAGAGHQVPLSHHALHDVEIELRLYGCTLLGQLQIPPWVRLTAAGCTFDAGVGSPASAVAIGAAGARVRLRNCTVRGVVEAGELEASSCAFNKPVFVGHRDQGWIRYSIIQDGGLLPRLHHCLEQPVSLSSVGSGDPDYLVLAANNGPIALTAGELGRVPGACGERTDHERELRTRTDMNLPISLTAFHLDRVTHDLARMRRSSQ